MTKEQEAQQSILSPEDGEEEIEAVADKLFMTYENAYNSGVIDGAIECARFLGALEEK